MDQDLRITALIGNVGKVIIGKPDIIELVITALIAGGHVLIEDVPGVGKTQLAAAMARSCGGEFGRIQMTPDVMPSDVTGFSLLKPGTGELEFRKGAVFCNFLLADEINRSSPKSQSALLEAMEELRVTMDGVTYDLPKPFMVLATQNPVETYGTYSLPEAQMDRFIMKLNIGYPGVNDELEIIRKGRENDARFLESVVTPGDIMELREAAEGVQCSEPVERYILRIVTATREDENIRLGVSPRGSIAMLRAARAYALVRGRGYILPDDVKFLAPFVFGHRLMLSPQGKSRYGNGQEMIRALIEKLEVPV
ncbi:MAG: MoxR family ATPase [Lachnospiraceae bacterium]|nr:MoxR family ATPase [Lachnospiraceae bacterium]